MSAPTPEQMAEWREDAYASSPGYGYGPAEKRHACRIVSLLDEIGRLRDALAKAEQERDPRVIAYRHEGVCDWVTNNSWCNCGLDEAYEKAIRDEAVQAADGLMDRAEKAEQENAELRQTLARVTALGKVNGIDLAVTRLRAALAAFIGEVAE